MNGAQLLIKALKAANTKYIIGYTGGAIMPFFDEMEKDGSFKFIMSRHEQGAAFIAQGLSRSTVSKKEQQIGICISTSGPGAMNLVTGIADAHMDSVPIMAITGQVATSVIGTDAFQESDVIGVMMPITKHTIMPLSPEEVEKAVFEGLYVAKTGRPGPVCLDVPKNVQQDEADKNYSFDYENYKTELPGFDYHPVPDVEKIEIAVEMINNSERPVIFCGHGVINSNSGAKLLKFAKKSNIPISFTLHGLSAIPVDHELSLGMMGMHGTVESNRAIANADLIIAFGMRFDDRVTGKLSEYAKNANVIHIEIDPSEIDKNVATSIAINADVSEALDAFLESNSLKKLSRKTWFEDIKEFKNEIADELESEIKKGVGKEGKLLMKTVVSKLSDLTKGKDLVVSDVGQHQMMSARFYNYQTPNSWFNSGGAGTMGASLPMAIGVKLGRPDERVWSISGDGGFQMNIQELGTIMEYEIDLKIIILNNEYLGMVRQWQTLFFDGRYAGTPMHNPDFSKIAEGYGISYKKVTKVSEIEKAIKASMEHKGAYVLEFLCDPSELILPMIPSGKTFDDMIVRVQAK
ncbi:MAG TPA: biosynthetic-type acetolactate synthase large subunit [Candidatus Dojkabacteria bacterium]|jgi:acetolactate synthase-1/2/3 large subunit